MSTVILTSLVDYLTGTLSPNDMRWVGEQLTNYASRQNSPMKRYTMEELNAMLDEAEQRFKAGEYLTDEEVWSKYEEELKEDE